MSYSLNEKELESVLRLKGPVRYEYFVKRVADWDAAWGLRNSSGWETVADNEGREMLPLWPHERFAQLCATDVWGNSIPTQMDLEQLVDGWVPELCAAGRLIAVFPLPNGPGIPVTPDRLKSDILEERSRFED
jgi:hypothetical protein